MTEKNCLTCKKFIMHKAVQKGNKTLSQGFAFGQDKKPCEHYPDNLSTTRDIMEAYVCEHFQSNELLENMDAESLNEPMITIHPFYISGTLPDFGNVQKSIENRNKEIHKIEKRIRRWIFLLGFSIGLLWGMIIGLIIYLFAKV